jgi:hypothetical protein
MLRYVTDSTYVEFPNTLHVDFYNDTMAVESQLMRSMVNTMNGRRKFTAGQCGSHQQNDRRHPTPPELWWINTQKIYTDKPVRIHTRDKVIFGQYGLVASQDFSEYVINQARGTLNVPKDSFLDNKP